MRYLLFSFLLLNFVLKCEAQLSFQATFLRPTHEFGSIMKPGFALEIGNSHFFTEGKFRFNASGSINIFTPRLESYRIYATSSGEEASYYPGTQSFSPYFSLNGNFGVEFSPLEDGKWFPYIGTDLIAGVYILKHEYSVPGISSSEETVFGPLLGGRVKGGLEVLLNSNTALFAQYTLGTNINFMSAMWSPQWGIGIGIKHEF